MTREYVERQARFPCKEGDRVKIAAKCESRCGGWETNWNPEMDRTVGHFGTVTTIFGDSGIFVELEDASVMPEDRNGWWYPYFVLSFPMRHNHD